MRNWLIKVITFKTPSSMQLWQIAWPMIIANISVPMLGFVDTAVIGQLGQAELIAGTALGSLVITMTFWLMGFLRMSTTGLFAHAVGTNNQPKLLKLLAEGSLLAICLAVIILVFREQIFSLLQYFVAQKEMINSVASAKLYFDIRVWAAPFVMLNLVFSGYLIASGNTKFVLKALVISNIINLVADVTFVVWLDLDVAGLAFAALAAEICLFLGYCFFVNEKLRFIKSWHRNYFVLNPRMLSLSAHIFVRSLVLQTCIAFMTIYAANYSVIAVAMNAILMQFFLFISFSMDGIAYAVEAKVGQNLGQSHKKKIKIYVLSALCIATVWAVFYTILYWLVGLQVVTLLTNVDDVIKSAAEFHGWMIIMPLVSYLSFIMDGVFVGLSWGKRMLQSMVISGSIFFITIITLNEWLNNHALWLAFSLFMATRGVSQLFILKWHLPILNKR